MSRDPFQVWPCRRMARCRGADEVPPLVVALSPFSSPEQIESRVDATAANGVQWVAQLVLATALSHFPEL
jgi:hypothetical protein